MLRRLAVLAALIASALASAAPPHLKHLPPGVLYQGPAPLALGSAKAGSSARIWLPGGTREFKVRAVVEHGGGDSTRFGTVEGFGHGAITLGRDGGFGRLTEGSTVWFLEFREDAGFAVRAGEAGLAIAADDDGALGVPPSMPKPSPMATPSPVRTVDLATLYDPDFAARYPGGLAATRIAHLVALANQSFADSEIAVVLRVVHTGLASGAVQPGIGSNVSSMRTALQSGGSFAGVNLGALRTSTGADVISFFRIHDMYARGACGIAYFPQSAGQYWYGVNVVVDGESAGSVCDEFVLAHELGHNLGAGHQSPDAGYFASSHAFVRLGQFNTMMGSFGTGSADRFRRLGRFSNPALSCGGMACGVAGASDNAGTMNALRAQIADYSASLGGADPTPPAPLAADSDGDTVADGSDAFPFDALQSVDADGDGVPASSDAFPTNGSEWADADQGGVGDNADPDDDNDGVPDGGDAFPLLQSESADADGDGTGDNADAFDNDPPEQRDTDNDGIGDRADTDDDGDGTIDVATLAATSDGELLVADGATDRILRFDGTTLAALGTLVQLGPGEVTLRSGLSAAASGEVYFVGGSELRRLDRLRATQPSLLLATYPHPAFGTGFPTTPVVAGNKVVFAEWGQWATGIVYTQDRADGLPVVAADYFGFAIDVGSAFHLARRPSGGVMALDGASGALFELDLTFNPGTSDEPTFADFSSIPAQASAAFAVAPGDRLFWVDRRDGALRFLLLPGGSGAAVTDIAGADARAVTVGPDGMLYVAKRSGGVQKYDPATGADLGEVLSAAQVGEPLALEWAPRILDATMPALPTPPALVVVPDQVVVTNAGGGGGAPDPLTLLVLALLAASGTLRRRAATSSSARRARASS